MGRKKYTRIIPKGIREEYIEKPTDEEMDIIQMAADSIIPFDGGRNYLVKLLKGSNAKIMKRNNAQDNDYYGTLKHLKMKDIERRVDWMIVKGWLKLVQPWKQPIIRHTEKGWEKAKKLWAEKLVKQMKEDLNAFLESIRDKHHEVKHKLLDKIQEDKITSLAAALMGWRKIGVRKVRKRINAIFRDWEQK